MKWLFSSALAVHGLIHFLGVARAFGTAERAAGVAWLTAGLAMLATAGAVLRSALSWWIVGLVAVTLSQAVIFTAWSDAGYGTVANVFVLAAVAYGFASQGPVSFRAEYRRLVDARLTTPAPGKLVTEADLGHLPALVTRYLRLTGAVGQSRVHHVRAAWRGRIRAEAEDPWMDLTAEQHNFPGEPARFFHMRAVRRGVPADVLHVYRSVAASMRVRLLSIFPVVDMRGEEMRHAETVTLLNDMCVFAPGTLIDPAIQWEEVDAHSVRARYTVGAHTVTAVLEFDEDGLLVDFVTDDRLASPDGKSFERWRWSTPLSHYRAFGALRVASRGEGWWHPPEGAFAYIELELLELTVNGPRQPKRRRSARPPSG